MTLQEQEATPKDRRLRCFQKAVPQELCYSPLKIVTPCMKNQTMEHRKTKNVKALYSLYENTWLCLPSL